VSAPTASAYASILAGSGSVSRSASRSISGAGKESHSSAIQRDAAISAIGWASVTASVARKVSVLLAGLAGCGLLSGTVQAQRAATDNRIENQIAVFAALDKVTARISKLEVPLGETVKFGALTVTPRACYTRSPLEPPKTTSFIEVTERQLDGAEKKIFSGWMFAESPGLNAVEHPVYDVWLTDCGKPKLAAVVPTGRSGQPALPTPGAKGAQPTAPGQRAPVAGQPVPGQGPAPGAIDPATGEEFKRRRPPR
jgi:hypothetical protein